MTSPLLRFGAYAAAFEQTYLDDDWSRLEPFFTEDAVYKVDGLPGFECELVGRANVFRGMKKSIDGFDRQMGTRQLLTTAPPVVTDTTVTIHGLARYARPPAPDRLDLTVTIVAELDGDRIRRLHDTLSLTPAGYAWIATHAMDLSGAYA
jgi:hypothetical protein